MAKKESSFYSDLPLGLGMALAQNQTAMKNFSNLNENEKKEIINKAHTASSKAEMNSIVNSLG